MDDQSRESVPVTSARARLFELVEDLLAGRRDRVELTLRAREDSVILMRKSSLRAMEADIQALQGRAGLEVQPLAGLGVLNVAPDQVLAKSRQRQAEQMAARKRGFAPGGTAGTSSGTSSSG